MPFIVPQFIEKESPIIGPLTFRQFIFVGSGIGLSIFLYFLIDSFILFILAALLVNLSAFALAFLKKGGFALPDLIQKFVLFLGKPKIYLWRKKSFSPGLLKSNEVKEPKEERKIEESPLKIAEKSRLKKLQFILETRTK